MKFNVNHKVKEEIRIEAGDVLESIFSGKLYLIVADNRTSQELYNYVTLGNVKGITVNNYFEIGKCNPLTIESLLIEIFGTTQVDSDKFILHKDENITMNLNN